MTREEKRKEPLFEYRVTIKDLWDGEDYSGISIGRTRSAARYKFIYDNFEDTRYSDTLNWKISVRKTGDFSPKSFFPDEQYKLDRWEQVKKARGIPFIYLGQRINVDGRDGHIVGSNGDHLHVLFDGNTWVDYCHPWWETTYYNEAGEIIKDYKVVTGNVISI